MSTQQPWPIAALMQVKTSPIGTNSPGSSPDRETASGWVAIYRQIRCARCGDGAATSLHLLVWASRR
jgi:hypothetical protein